MPKVSVVLPIYNTSQYLREALDSVTRQTLKDIEIICVNDGSTDNSLDIVKEYAAKDNRIVVIDKPNGGYGHTMNVGMDAATGEYFGILETDDYLALTMYEDLYSIAVENNLDTIRGDFYQFTCEKNGNIDLQYIRVDNGRDFYNRMFNPSLNAEYTRSLVNTWAGIYRLSFLREYNIRHNETPGASFQDNGFFWQVQIYASRAMLVNKPYYYYRWDNPNSSVRDSTKVWAMRREYDFIKNILAKEIDVWNRFRGYYWRKRFWNYDFTVGVIAPHHKWEFIMEISKEYQAAQEAGELSPEVFTKEEWAKIQNISRDPVGYIRKNYPNSVASGIADKGKEASKISVIIPCYNVERYLRQTLDSVIHQTFKNIEIICIDDASTDGTLAILREYEKNDPRIKVIAHDSNKSVSQARKDGVMAASGEYILFLDGDDFYELNACKELYEIIKKEKVDIVHFGTRLLNENNADKLRIENMEKFLKPYSGKLNGEKVFLSCFMDKKYGYSLWNKIFTAELCKKAFWNVKDGDFPKAEDLYAFYIICYFAKSYYGVPAKVYYNYRFGAGITGHNIIDLARLETHCKSVWAADCILQFANGCANESQIKAAGEIRKNLLNECIWNWDSFLLDQYKAAGFSLLSKYWNADELVAALCSKFLWYGKRKLSQRVLGAESLRCRQNNDIRTVGVFYHRYARGGVQRVLSLLIPMYISMGYNVILFTDEYSTADDYRLPDGVTRVVLPSSLTIKKDDYLIRARAFQEALRKHNVDLLFYHAASSGMLLFDMLLVKLMRIPFVLTVHEIAFRSMLFIDNEIVYKKDVFKIPDRVTVLSKMEEKIWRAFGVNAVYIPNPMDNDIIVRDKAKIETNSILWVGRLEIEQKRCIDTISIMKEVVKEIPDAKLMMVGNEVTKDIRKILQASIQKNRLENNIILCGYSPDVSEYYQKASVHILTSVWESFGMVILESKSYGLPLVMYELPYLEIVKDKRGFISVEQKNTKAMAEAVVALLKDDALREKMSEEAKDSLVAFRDIDIEAMWRNVIDGIYNKTKESIVKAEDKELAVMLQAFLSLYEAGHTNIQERLKKASSLDELNRFKNEVQDIYHSRTYRVGKALLFLPKLFRKGIKTLVRKKDR